MGRARAFLLVMLALAGSGFAFGGPIPEILIVQRRIEKNRLGDPNLEIGDFVSQEFADDGRVSPIYWSMTDAIFRSMVQSGKAPSAEPPSIDEALEIAKVMKFTYVLMVEAHTDRNGTVLARAELYKGDDAAIWIDPSESNLTGSDVMKRLVKSGRLSQLDADKLSESNGYRKYSVGTKGSFDAMNTLKSIAHTWAELLETGAFSGLQSRPQQIAPDPIAGPLIRLEKTEIQVPKVADNAQVFKDVDSQLRDGHKEAAILVLRNAVDAEPFDLPRREALIKLLNDSGHPDLAAAEAARAATLNPGSGGFRLEGARSALAAGSLDAAATAAKDALAHDPKNSDAHVILGEVNLFKLNFDAAIVEFDAACATNPTTEAVYYRSIAKAFTGDVKGSAADCESAHHGSVVQPVPPYAVTMSVFDSGVQACFDSVKNLLPAVALGNNAQELTASITTLQGEATAASAFLGSWASSKNHAPSHERRILALKLLSQSCGEIVSYLSKRDDETLTDARIDLGEAIKQYKSAKELFVGEAAE